MKLSTKTEVTEYEIRLNKKEAGRLLELLEYARLGMNIHSFLHLPEDAKVLDAFLGELFEAFEEA